MNNATFSRDTIYPLNDPTFYDNKFCTGYGYALVADNDPGACWRVDCWIVNEQGDKHPDIDMAPSPIEIDDIDIEQGRPFVNSHGLGRRPAELTNRVRW
jgi:hypothetical protein